MLETTRVCVLTTVDVGISVFVDVEGHGAVHVWKIGRLDGQYLWGQRG